MNWDFPFELVYANIDWPVVMVFQLGYPELEKIWEERNIKGQIGVVELFVIQRAPIGEAGLGERCIIVQYTFNELIHWNLLECLGLCQIKTILPHTVIRGPLPKPLWHGWRPIG